MDTHCTNSKWIKNYILRLVFLLEEHIEKKLHSVSLGNIFLSMASKAQAIKAKTKQVELHPTEKFCIVKRNSQYNEKAIYETEKYLQTVHIQ
jgi:hypothetical protein